MKDELWNILNKTTDWVKYSDAKAVFILTLYGVVFTIIYSNANNVYSFVSHNWFTISVTTLSIISSAISCYFSFLVINPRLKNPNPHSLIYFGHIQEKYKSFSNYYNDFKSTFSNKEEYEKQLAEQIHINSIIAWKKFKNVSISIRFLFVATILLLIDILTYFLI